MKGWLRGIVLLVLVASSALLITPSLNAEAATVVKKAVTPADASPAPVMAPDVSTSDLQSLITVLDNDDQRKAFLATLKSAVAVRKAEEAKQQADAKKQIAESLLAHATTLIRQTERNVANGFGLYAQISDIAQGMTDTLNDPEARANLTAGFIKLFIIVAGSLAVLTLVRLPLRHWGGHIVLSTASDHWATRIMGPMLLLGLDMVPSLVLAVVTVVILTVVGDGTNEASAFHDLLAAAASTMIGLSMLWSLSKTLLTPRYPYQRLLSLTDEAGRVLRNWLRRLGALAILELFLGDLLLAIGISDEVSSLLRKLVGLVFAILLAVFLRQNRKAVAKFIRLDLPYPKPGQRRGLLDLTRDRAAAVWHVLAIAYIAAAFFVWAAEVPDGFIYLLRATVFTAVTLVVAFGCAVIVRNGLVRLLTIPENARHLYPALSPRGHHYVQLFDTVFRRILGAVVAVLILAAWGVDVFRWLNSGLGVQILRAVGTIAAAMLLALLAWAFVTTRMDRYLSEVDAEGNPAVRSARIKTMLPLLRNFLFVVLVVVAGLVVLDALGINTAPLLAGAGVVGLAVGFGSQKLVQDIITGIFMLFEDTIAVGDVVDLGGHLGEVESLSIRSLRLRDYNGHVHTVPFSAVSTVVNLTKVYSYAVLDTRVRFEADTDQVSATMTAVVEELRADPAFGDLILDSIDLKGVDPFGDSSVKIVARLRTLPKKQWDVQREFNRRLKKVLEREGINLSIANHTINEVPPDDVLPSEPVGEHPAS